MPPKIHPIQTGVVQIKHAQMESRGKGLARTAHILFDGDWSDWLPIFAWVIEHAEGIMVVDTGETARVHEPGYHPRWHPFYRMAVRFKIAAEEEIGPRLKALGIAPADVRQVLMTHLHTDHAGGLGWFEKSRIWVHRPEYESARSTAGRMLGYLPHRWPRWWQPEFMRLDGPRLGPFDCSMKATAKGDVLVLPTPGHTPAHVSVFVRGTPSYFLAGDTSYNEGLLRAGKVDGVSPSMQAARESQAKILALASQEPMIYLPAHDPGNLSRIGQNCVLAQSPG
jgi:N-acyl homoserine lactone hydrolase